MNEDHIDECIAEIQEMIQNYLETVGAEVEAQVARNTRVKTGQTKGSWEHRIKEDTVYIGSNYENAIWEEFGTGEYALEGNGRKDPWKYQDADGQWHTTRGKKGTRALHKSGRAIKSKLRSIAVSIFGSMKWGKKG